MLRKIETRELLTSYEARQKYKSNLIIMEIEQVVNGQDRDLGYVRYTVDKERELRLVPKDEFEGKRVALLEGGLYEPLYSFSRIMHHEED